MLPMVQWLRCSPNAHSFVTSNVGWGLPNANVSECGVVM
jgi:hypothetical protein